MRNIRYSLHVVYKIFFFNVHRGQKGGNMSRETEAVSHVNGQDVAQSVRLVDKKQRLFPGVIIYTVDKFGSVAKVLFSGVLIGSTYENAKEDWILQNAEEISNRKDAGQELRTFCDNPDGIA